MAGRGARSRLFLPRFRVAVSLSLKSARWIRDGCYPLVCAAVVWFALSKDARGVRGEDVVALTPEPFEQEVGLDNGALVEFCAPWCGYCKKLAPEYESLASFFKSTRNVLIARVDCDEHKSLCSKYDIKRFPTILWFPKGSLKPKEYHGERTAVALAKFVNRVLRVV